MYGYSPMFFSVYTVSLLISIVLGSTQKLMSCGTVAEVFAKRVGPADSVPVSPLSDATLTECSSTLVHTKGTSCCTADMERQFLLTSTDYLREHIRMSNRKLKAVITQSLHLFQDHLRQSLHEAHNKTADTLSKLYRIPKNVHRKTLDSFFGKLNNYLMGNHEHSLSVVIDSLFSNMFPIVFDYVLSDPSKLKLVDEDFDNCLLKHYNNIQPFGNTPKDLVRKMKYSFQRSGIYTEALEVMIRTIDSADSLIVHSGCKKALTRLQFCSMCSGEVEARPCRGLCLNVMRGCLSGISEISSSWDDLVVDFENLHQGMFKHNAHELLSFIDANITDALLHALDDGPRIFTQVMAHCRESSKTLSETDLYKKFPTPEGLLIPHPSNRIQGIKKDISALISQLDESKGFLQRLADGLCRTPVIYDQDMQSETCWNGSAVGRYMREVPEANVISQANHNMEVRITLIPDPILVKVKDTLIHMKRNLSVLYNEELMLSDQSYKTIVSSGGGFSQGRDVTIDDEDFVDRNSGSGSGGRSDDDDDDDRKTGDKPMFTSRPVGGDGGRGYGNNYQPGGGNSGSGGGSRNTDGRDKGNRSGHRSSSTVTVSKSFTLLSVYTVFVFFIL